MVPKTRVFQAADGEDLVIPACTVFDWSTRVTDGRTDGRTELRWLRRAESSAFVHKKPPLHMTITCEKKEQIECGYW